MQLQQTKAKPTLNSKCGRIIYILSNLNKFYAVLLINLSSPQHKYKHTTGVKRKTCIELVYPIFYIFHLISYGILLE